MPMVRGAMMTSDAAPPVPVAAGEQTLAVDVADIAGIPSGQSADRDPFNARQSWLLRFDQDVYAISATSATAQRRKRIPSNQSCAMRASMRA